MMDKQFMVDYVDERTGEQKAVFDFEAANLDDCMQAFANSYHVQEIVEIAERIGHDKYHVVHRSERRMTQLSKHGIK